ncbi:MAG: hypothetical protein ABH806_02920 [Candidatus Omnitrophota bacterium]
MDPKRLKSYKIVLVVFLLGITIFSLFKYLLMAREKYVLLNELNQAGEQVLALEERVQKEKELQNALAKENSALKDELMADTEKLTQLQINLQNSQKTIEQIIEQIALAKTENAALREEKGKIILKLNWVSQERDGLKARLSSLSELKETIREVKIRTQKAKSIINKITESKRAIAGNRGYLVRDGESTFTGAKIKIEVMPTYHSK